MKQLLSPRELADAIGVSESSLKRWADEGLLRVSRTAGGHRRISVREAVRYIREAGLPIIKPSLLGLGDLENMAAMSAGDRDSVLLEALVQGHGESVRGVILSAYLDGATIAELCDGPIARAMRHIGELWNHGSSGIFVEHRASDLCLAALNQLRWLVPAVQPTAPLAVGGGLSNDPYLLPSLMAAMTLADQGWRETNLGPDTPANVLAEAAIQYGASLVWVSFSVDESPDRLRRKAEDMLERLQGHDMTLVVGGRVWPRSLKPTLPRLHVAGSMTELAAFAKGLAAARHATTPGASPAGDPHPHHATPTSATAPRRPKAPLPAK